MSTDPSASPQEPPKRRGRPPGSALPPDRRKDAMIRVRVTSAQADAYRSLGGDAWLRKRLDRGR